MSARKLPLTAITGSFIHRQQVAARSRLGGGQPGFSLNTEIGGTAMRNGRSNHFNHFADGVFFIDLAPVGDAELVSATMARACGLLSGEGPGISSVSIDERLIAALARRKSLLIVDNCEHLVEGVADLLDRILAECAEVSLLASSREALGVEGEQTVPVPSLALPDAAALGRGRGAGAAHAALRLVSGLARRDAARTPGLRPGHAGRSRPGGRQLARCRRLVPGQRLPGPAGEVGHANVRLLVAGSRRLGGPSMASESPCRQPAPGVGRAHRLSPDRRHRQHDKYRECAGARKQRNYACGRQAEPVRDDGAW